MIIFLILFVLIPLIVSAIVWKTETQKSKARNDGRNYYDSGDFITDHFLLFFLNIFSIFGIVIAGGFLFWICDGVVAGNLVDEKIEVTQNQNAEIEEKVKLVVEKYIQHESSTYKDLKPEEIIIAATVYPELQSNQIVQEQIKLYEANNQKIVSLKEEKINAKVKRWWLYFGN